MITPPDQTSMTVEAREGYGALITVERGNGTSVQVMDLTMQEWCNLRGMLETFGATWSPSVHLTFRALDIRHGNA